MAEMTTTAGRADYGIDAPRVIFNLALSACAAGTMWTTAALGLWSGIVKIPLPGTAVSMALRDSALFIALSCTFLAVWMLWGSKVGKLRERETLLNRIKWAGDEQVLDVGCGRGLMLIAAAKRLRTGHATGIDIWQSEDLSGNRVEAAQANAELEGVADRVDIQTADMRDMPFPDASFDVVVSRVAIHNIYDAEGRRRAIAEIARVLKPGGRALIGDIRHGKEYTATFTHHGCAKVERTDSFAASVLLTLLTFGSLRPATLLVQKDA